MNIKLIALVTLVAAAISIVGCAKKEVKQEVKQETKQETPVKQLSNKDKVVELLKSIETGTSEPAGYINPNKYIQHNLSAEDGLAGFGKLLQALPKGSAKINTVRAFEDGNFVVAQTEYNFFGPKAGFDIFRFEDGKIVEHWDNLQEIAGPNPSGHTMFDGSTEIKDLDKTEANKELVNNFVQDVLMGKNPNKLASYFNGDNYIQHNPAIADNLTGLGAALKAMADKGIVMKYDKIHMTLGQGNFVLVVSEGSFGGKHTSYYDLFRVENGKVAEHWDVMETILPKDQWKNQNGKF
jgi:predicted SnoaL-like aldol condensation-catalyzing enzyme